MRLCPGQGCRRRGIVLKETALPEQNAKRRLALLQRGCCKFCCNHWAGSVRRGHGKLYRHVPLNHPNCVLKSKEARDESAAPRRAGAADFWWCPGTELNWRYAGFQFSTWRPATLVTVRSALICFGNFPRPRQQQWTHLKRSVLFVGLALFAAAEPAYARTVLFVGNSFTYGELSPVMHYRTSSVTDLNGNGLGGVPALFQAFTAQAGLDYDVSLETVPGVGLDYHYANKRALLDRKWDEVVLQSFSTLDTAHPGDPALLTKYAAAISDMLRRQNPNVKIYLTATWSRADMTYPSGTPWYGKPIQQMGKDVAAGYRFAAEKNSGVAGIIPVGLAWNRAIDTGLADPNPYDGIAAGTID